MLYISLRCFQLTILKTLIPDAGLVLGVTTKQLDGWVLV